MDEEKTVNIPTERKKPDIKKPVIIVAAILLLVLLVCLVVSGGSSAKNERVISARLDDNGTAIIPLGKDKVLEIDDEAVQAYMRADSKYVVVLREDGKLYVTDKELSDSTQIAKDAASIMAARNQGFVYMTEDGEAVRVLFSDLAKLKLGENINFVAAKNSISLVFAAEGKVYLLPEDSNEMIKLDKYSETAYPKLVSDDGKFAVWATVDDGEQTIMIRDGEEDFRAGKVEGNYYDTYARFDLSQETMVITNSASGYMWLKTRGQDVVKVKMGGAFSTGIYTDEGYYTLSKLDSKDKLYTVAYKNSSVSLYSITQQGEKERLLSDVQSFEIASGVIAYIDEDGDLYAGELKKDGVENEERISRDVWSFRLSDDGKFIYYMSECEDYYGELYCYNFAKEKEEIISDEVFCNTRYNYDHLYLSSDGSVVYFFSDYEDLASGDTAADLYCWSWGDKEPERISSEVVVNSLSSSTDDGSIDSKDFTFLRYPSLDGAKLYADWIRFDGKDTMLLARDVSW